jgi:enoyl-CoA hydratase/carnithine racemase
MIGEPMTFAAYEKSGRVATITLNRPESRNAIGTQQDCDDLAGALWRANDDEEINAVILTGAGKAFCAGGDLKAIRERSGIGPRATPDGTRANYRRGVHAIIKALAEVEVATIAAINGHAIGLGLDIGILCDMRLAGASAKMASSFVKVGIIPGDGGAWILTNAIGATRAAELVLTGDPIDADAHVLGSVAAPTKNVVAHGFTSVPSSAGGWTEARAARARLTSYVSAVQHAWFTANGSRAATSRA